jgi:hypothetical protein
MTVGGGVVEAHDCSGDGSPGTASSTSVSDGTIVGWLVSMTMRSGGCRMDAIRITGLLIASRAGSGKDWGRHQSARNSKARSDAPTQAMYLPIGNHLSPRYNVTWAVTTVNERRAEMLVRIGFFQRRGSRDDPTFWVPFLYRDALEMIQGLAEE